MLQNIFTNKKTINCIAGQDDPNADTEDTVCDTKGVTCHGTKDNTSTTSHTSTTCNGNKDNTGTTSYNSIYTDKL